MFEVDSEDSSDHDHQYSNDQTNKNIVSILRHLPEARKLMQGHNYEHQITKCMYNQPLSNNPAFIVPKTSNTQNSQLSHNRLVKLEEAIFQHENMKQNIRTMFQKDSKGSTQSINTLWNVYGSLTPSYARFGVNAKKNNFANVIMPINGVNIILSTKMADRHIQSEQKIFPMSPDSIRFDSHFQSGNLLYAYRKQSLQIETYDLILQNDINTKGHNQWFYFKIYNSKKHNRIRFNIVNFIKRQSMFSYGIKPLVFSQRDFARHRLGWVRDGQKIYYYDNKIKRQCNNKNYYTLTFEYYFREIDTVYFAPVHPYTFTQLVQYFDNLMAQYSLSNFLCLKNVTETVGRNSISVLTFGTGKRQIKDCRVCWILSRQHPGETTSSFMVQGIINYLISLYNSGYSQILDTLIFKIVPMINVDGVIHGNTRAELTGVDPNRMWKKTMKRLCPGVSVLKKLIAENKQSVRLVLDLHSHSKKLGCFFYGNSLLHDPASTKIYPTIVCDNDERFELKHCRFRGGYETTARSVLFYDLGIKQVYTVECSLMGYLKKNRITEYKITDYYEMGRKLIDSFIQLQKSKIVKEEKQIIEQIGYKMLNNEDAESARSQSSLSDEEYEEIRTKVKHKIKKKKIKKNQNQNISAPNEQARDQDLTKYFVKKNGRVNTKIQFSIIQKKKRGQDRELSTNDLKSKINQVYSKNSENRAPQTSVKRGGTIVLKEASLKLNQNRRLAQRDQNQEKKTVTNFSLGKIKRDTLQAKQSRDPARNVICEKKQVDVQASIVVQDRYNQGKKSMVKSKADHPLCVIGSSLQDDLLFIGKNEVGIQVHQQLIDQTILVLTEGNKKSLKIKKMPKILNYLCSNLIGVQQQNSVFPQDRRLAPIPSKKSPNFNNF